MREGTQFAAARVAVEARRRNGRRKKVVEVGAVQNVSEGRPGGLRSEQRLEDTSLTVLVVDDQPEVLEASAALLRVLGFKVLSADSGEAALDILRMVPGIDVMLTDVVMPRMDGLTLANQARQVAPGTKVILMSAYAMPALRALIASSQFEVLAKPFRSPDLARVLRS